MKQHIPSMALALYVLLAAPLAGAQEVPIDQISPWFISMSGGYGQFFRVSGVDADTPSTVSAPAVALELGERFGSGHQIALRGDFIGTQDGPGTYREVYAYQLGASYGYVVALGAFRIKGTAGLAMGASSVAQSDVIETAGPYPGLFATAGLRWKPAHFVGIGADFVGSSVGGTLSGLASVEFALPQQ